MFKRVLIANRGEIAVRIGRTLRDMGITCIAAFSDADRDALFVQEADEAYRLGPAPAGESYLNVGALLACAKEARAEAIHPGYGFLSETAAFAREVASAGLTFIGPSQAAIALMGDKVAARHVASQVNVPTVPGTPAKVETLQDAIQLGEEIGYPLAVKASGGGGGRGIRLAGGPSDLSDALEEARREARSYFKNPDVYLERYFAHPHHVEIQVVGDETGRVVHLGERDCSVQRRHQKLIEETPSPVVSRRMREQMGEMALRIAAHVGYTSAGTVEFLVTPDDGVYFLEMNTRIQVEHPVTEEVTGVDLIREMVLVAAHESMSIVESVTDPKAHAIEVRINAENALEGFRPDPVAITDYREPGGVGIRVDTGVYSGYRVPPHYDSLIAKLIAVGPDRQTARIRAVRALSDYIVGGPCTTIDFARLLLNHQLFVEGDASTTFLDEHLDEIRSALPPTPPPGHGAQAQMDSDGKRYEVLVNRKRFEVQVAEIRTDKSESPRQRARKRSSATRGSSDDQVVESPMHGTVMSIARGKGEPVQSGETLFLIEAMKMENEVPATRSGILQDIDVEVGDTVEAGQRLAVIV